MKKMLIGFLLLISTSSVCFSDYSVTVLIPDKVIKRYTVKDFGVNSNYYRLELDDGKAIYVPQAFTIIEEE